VKRGSGSIETWEWPGGKDRPTEKLRSLSGIVLGQIDEPIVLLDLVYISLTIHTLPVENKPLPLMETWKARRKERESSGDQQMTP
jgi:hypothetical protein